MTRFDTLSKKCNHHVESGMAALMTVAWIPTDAAINIPSSFYAVYLVPRDVKQTGCSSSETATSYAVYPCRRRSAQRVGSGTDADFSRSPIQSPHPVEMRARNLSRVEDGRGPRRTGDAKVEARNGKRCNAGFELLISSGIVAGGHGLDVILRVCATTSARTKPRFSRKSV
jgi:hypothetical protein